MYMALFHIKFDVQFLNICVSSPMQILTFQQNYTDVLQILAAPNINLGANRLKTVVHIVFHVKDFSVPE